MVVDTTGTIGPVAGFPREATVRFIDLNRATMRVTINLAKSDTVRSSEIDIPIPAAWQGPNGEFSGGCPAIGSTIWIVLGQGGRWAPLPYVPNNDIFGDTNRASSFKQRLMSALRPGRWLTQVSGGLIRIIADPTDGVIAGSPCDFIQIDPSTPQSNRSIFSYRFKQFLGFTEANARIEGPVRRDLSANSNRNVTGSALSSHTYDDSLTTIGLDPLTKAGGAFNRNPPYAESREITYEFARSFGFIDDETEISILDNENIPKSVSSRFLRAQTRADACGLNFVIPNRLLETVKGTLIDVYGNILDLNLAKLPNGNIDELSFRANSENQSETFIRLRELNRRSIAYKFEINAQKASIPDKDTLFISSDESFTDNRRVLSNLTFLLDKEGQFKFNIPSSSETGNIGLLTRSMNFNILRAFEDDSDPKEFIRSTDNIDLLLEDFGVGVISLVSEDEILEGFAAPIDRITEQPIKLGTAFHDLQQTLQLHNRGSEDSSILPVPFDEDSPLNDTGEVPFPGDVVSPNIIVSGPNANAGGRSGTISCDGHVSINIGANTIDRQSLWIDCAGGVVANYGRDLSNRSYVGRMDGDLFLSVGGATVGNDNRFSDSNNGARDGVIDIRVAVNNQLAVIRIDSKGLRIAHPGAIDIISAGNLRVKSLSDLILDGKNVFVYADNTSPRWVRRKPGETIG